MAAVEREARGAEATRTKARSASHVIDFPSRHAMHAAHHMNCVSDVLPEDAEGLDREFKTPRSRKPLIRMLCFSACGAVDANHNVIMGLSRARKSRSPFVGERAS